MEVRRGARRDCRRSNTRGAAPLLPTSLGTTRGRASRSSPALAAPRRVRRPCPRSERTRSGTNDEHSTCRPACTDAPPTRCLCAEVLTGWEDAGETKEAFKWLNFNRSKPQCRGTRCRAAPGLLVRAAFGGRVNWVSGIHSPWRHSPRGCGCCGRTAAGTPATEPDWPDC